MNRSHQDVVHFRAAGVSLVLEVSGPRLPRVLHWGADLGFLAESDRDALRTTTTPGNAAGAFDESHLQAIVPEQAWGWMGTPGVSGSRNGHWHSPQFVLSSVAFEGAEGSSDVQAVRAIAVEEDAHLRLEVDIEMFASGLVRARASIESLDGGDHDGDYSLDDLLVMFPVPREADELMDFTGRWTRERTPIRAPFTPGSRVRASRRGKPGHDSPFATVVGPSGFGFRSGEVWLTHVGWSGNVKHVAERDNAGVSVLGGGEHLMPGEIRLGPGDRYEGPWVYGAYGADGLDAASGRFHEYLRGRVQHPQRPRPVTLNTWEAVYFDHDEAALRDLAERAARIGVERFVLDDGWFMGRRSDNAGLGDWFVDETLYPHGLRPLADHVRSLGMEFGLWVEPEMINPDSRLASEHPEWIAQSGSGRLPLEARRQQVLDLSHPRAFDFIRGRLFSLVSEIKPSYLKWDHNRDLLEAGSAVAGTPTPHAQTLAFYRLLDELKTEFPGLEIESCAGGGGRIDMGVLERADRVWPSDTNDPRERQQIQRWTSLIVPPEMMGAHIGPGRAHTTHRHAELNFRAATALFGHLGIEWNIASEEATAPAARAQLESWIVLYKQYRGLLHSGAVVNSDFPESARVVRGVVAHDRSEALFSVASVDTVAANPVGLIRLPGLDPDRRYRPRIVAARGDGPAANRALPPWLSHSFGMSGPPVPGAVLNKVGVQWPAMMPDDALVIHLTAA